jgi:hypothetical protein
MGKRSVAVHRPRKQIRRYPKTETFWLLLSVIAPLCRTGQRRGLELTIANDEYLYRLAAMSIKCIKRSHREITASRALRRDVFHFLRRRQYKVTLMVCSTWPYLVVSTACKAPFDCIQQFR